MLLLLLLLLWVVVLECGRVKLGVERRRGKVMWRRRMKMKETEKTWSENNILDAGGGADPEKKTFGRWKVE